MTRPTGDVRHALAAAARQLYRLRLNAPLEAADGALLVGGTARELAGAAVVGFEVARMTIKNMVQAGELQRVGDVREAHSSRPAGVYAPAEQPGAMAWGRTPATEAMQAMDVALVAMARLG